MSEDAPVLDPRSQADVLGDLIERLSGYTPAWVPQEGTPGAALLHIFSRYVHLLIRNVNQLPLRGQMAFLEMLGVSSLPARAARAPLVFALVDDSPIDTQLLPGSRVAAVAGGQEQTFAVEKGITLARARLTRFYVVDPLSDQAADYSDHLSSGFTLFGDMELIEHAIYLGHDRLFNMPQESDVIINFDLVTPAAASVRQDIEIAWEYLSESSWHTLSGPPVEGLVTNGQVVLNKRLGPDSKQESIAGHTSYWIRGRLSKPLPAPQKVGTDTLPVLDRVRARVSLSRSDLRPEVAFADLTRLDIGDMFYPFGAQPALYSTFYLGSNEVFQHKGARIRLHVLMQSQGVAKNQLALTWDYYNGRDWSILGDFLLYDGTDCFTKKQTAGEELIVTFVCPSDWTPTSVNGETTYWMRARISQGDYGGPPEWAVSNGKVTVVKASQPAPPIVAALTLSYTYLTDPEPLDHCLVANNYQFEDVTEASLWPRQTFVPFQPVLDQSPAVYMGFDRQLPVGLISLYVDVTPDPDNPAPYYGTSPYTWEYFSVDGWSELSVSDETSGFRQSGIIQFIAPHNLALAYGPGGDLFRIRARLKQEARLQPVRIAGIWMNSVWAAEHQSFDQIPLGLGDGNPGQTLSFPPQGTPVLEGETIEILEWTGRGRGWEALTEGVPEEDLRRDLDPLTNDVRAVWVRWRWQPYLYASGPMDRHYTLDRAGGLLRLGDGRYGMIPPAGARIVATYTSGGGVVGNLPVGAISELRSAIPFIQAVANPIPSAGGAETEQVAFTQRRGPQRIHHLGRAISVEDFEWLAREASPAVAQAHCLPVTGPDGRVQRGWVTVVIAPHSGETQPQPSAELQRQVREYLSARVPATLARRVRVIGPTYLPVSLIAEIVPEDASEAARVEAQVRAAANRFLHPLYGGLDGLGWGFGEGVYLSQMAAVIEAIPGVDYARHLELTTDGHTHHQHVPGHVGLLIAPGSHEIRLMLGEG